VKPGGRSHQLQHISNTYYRYTQQYIITKYSNRQF